MPYLSFVLALALLAGLAAGVLIDGPLALRASLSLAAAWTFALLAYDRNWPRAQLACLALAVSVAGTILGAHAVDRALHTPLRTTLEQRLGGFHIDGMASGRTAEPIVIEGRLREDAVLTATGATLRLSVDRLWIGAVPEPTTGGVSLSVGGAMHGDHLAQWTAGRRVRAPALLRRPATYLNEGLADPERALARRGITLVGSIKSAALVEIQSRGAWWDELAARVRRRTRRALNHHVRPRGEQSAAIATAILIGERAGLDDEVEQRLQQAGTYHVIAISGGNIAILAGVVLGALAWAGWRGRVAALSTIIVLAAYAAIAAGGASVARATLMATIYLAVRLIDQRTAAANAIALTAVVLLLIDPLSITDVGFWLTFGATTAIVAGASLVAMPARSSVRIVTAVLVATVCVELALTPVAATVFQRVTFAGLLLNFVALPAMTVVQVGAMGVVFCDIADLQRAAAGVGQVVHLGCVVLTASARLLDYAPWLTWRVPSPPVALVASYYAAVAIVIVPRSVARSVRRCGTAAAIALFLAVIGAPQARLRAEGDGRLHLTMIDVGQGDAMVVTFPNGRTLGVDTGGASIRGPFDIGDRVIGPVLRARQLLQLDYLAVTHGDPDHVGGARSVVRDFTPREIWWGVPVARHDPTARVRVESDHARAAWRTLQRGDRLEIGGAEVRVHHPLLPDWERQRVRNDDSLVLEVRIGRVSVLLTGDIGHETERELLPILDLLPTVVLKVAHHGSSTSSSEEFIERFKPRVALIGVGRGNPYGHPVPNVLERLRRVGSEVFRTDLDGQVSVVTDGRSLEVVSFTGRKFAYHPSCSWC